MRKNVIQKLSEQQFKAFWSFLFLFLITIFINHRLVFEQH